MGCCCCCEERRINLSENEIYTNQHSTRRNKRNIEFMELRKSKKESNQEYFYTDEYTNLKRDLILLFNSIRTNPQKFLYKSNEHFLREEFQILKKGNEMKYSDYKYIEIRNYLSDIKNNGKSDEEKEDEIFNILGVNCNDSYICKSISNISKPEENLWNLFENNADELDIIISDYFEYLMIICEPIGLADQILTTYILYNKHKYNGIIAY